MHWGLGFGNVCSQCTHAITHNVISGDANLTSEANGRRLKLEKIKLFGQNQVSLWHA